MKKKIIIGLSIVILIAIISIVVFNFVNGRTLKLKETVFVYELGNKVSFTPKDFLKDSTKKEIIKNANLEFKNSYSISTDNNELKSLDADYLNVGEYEVLLTYKGKSVSFVIKVEDNVPPEFIDFKEEIVVEQNAKDVDLTTFYDANDLSGITIVVESDYDISEVGEYDATIKVADRYKNINEKKSKIKVIKYEDITDSNLSKNIEGKIYKSEKRLTEENKPKESNSVVYNNNKSNSQTTNQNTQTGQQQTVEQNVSVPTYRRDIANQYVSRINAYRKEKGLNELPVTAEAQNEADMRAKQIVSNFSHNSSYGFGENIGRNVAGYDFVQAWKDSWSHNNAMLREQNTALAVSIYEVDGWWYAVTSFRMNY